MEIALFLNYSTITFMNIEIFKIKIGNILCDSRSPNAYDYQFGMGLGTP